MANQAKIQLPEREKIFMKDVLHLYSFHIVDLVPTSHNLPKESGLK